MACSASGAARAARSATRCCRPRHSGFVDAYLLPCAPDRWLFPGAHPGPPDRPQRAKGRGTCSGPRRDHEEGDAARAPAQLRHAPPRERHGPFGSSRSSSATRASARRRSTRTSPSRSSAGSRARSTRRRGCWKRTDRAEAFDREWRAGARPRGPTPRPAATPAASSAARQRVGLELPGRATPAVCSQLHSHRNLDQAIVLVDKRPGGEVISSQESRNSDAAWREVGWDPKGASEHLRQCIRPPEYHEPGGAVRARYLTCAP